MVRVQGNEISIRQKERGSMATGSISMIKYVKVAFGRLPELNVWEETVFSPCRNSVTSPEKSTNPSQACADPS